MKEEQIRAAFMKVKQEMDYLKGEISLLKLEILGLKDMLIKLQNTQNRGEIPSVYISTDSKHTSTYPATSTHTSTVPQEIEGLKYPNLGISIGNEGASTDRQTDRQTDKSPEIPPEIPFETHIEKPTKITMETDIQKASKILDSLDKLKREIRFKFKKVTQQEMLVFSTIYQLEEQDPDKVTYKEVAVRLSLSESSIRDYVQRMINKGIPIKKHKINNKKLILSISSNLKKIAPLSTIIQLREL